MEAGMKSWLFKTFGRRTERVMWFPNGWRAFTHWYDMLGMQMACGYWFKGPPTTVDWTRVRVYDPDTGEVKIVSSDEYEKARGNG